MTFEHLGSVSTGTMLNGDLIPCFLDVARVLGCDGPWIAEIQRRMDTAEGYFGSEESAHDVSELFDVLNEQAPSYCYFGAHPGDGADYGFWPDFEAIDYDGIPDGQIIKSADPPDGAPGSLDDAQYHLWVNDHGNATMYYYDSETSAWVEEWAVV